MRVACFSWLVLLAAGAVAMSCSEDLPEPIDPGASDGGADAGPTTLDRPSLGCADPADSVYGDPGPLPADPNARGDVLRCATEPVATVDALQAKLKAPDFTGKPLTTGARVYRIAYRTERGDPSSSPGVSSALVYVPEKPRAAKLPIVVAARGSRGQAAKCAVTKLDPSLEGINADAYALVYSLVGYGYAVILPDLAGYANFGASGNPPSAYAQAADVGKSTLDAARALKKLFPALDDKVVVVGHSQGGHSALSALALAESYGTAGPIVGVATYAPLWLSQRSWGAVLYRPVGANFPIADSPAASVSVWYHYTQAELLDGPGEGKKLFAPGKQDAIEAFVKNECWGSPELTKLGSYADELFDPAFVSEVGQPATAGSACTPGTPCEKWIPRYSADRPHLTGKAAETPILLAYGLADTTLPPPRMRCALDRLKADGVKLTACVDADKTHGGIVGARAEYVADWIASLTVGGPAPAACPANEAALTAECQTPPPND